MITVAYNLFETKIGFYYQFYFHKVCIVFGYYQLPKLNFESGVKQLQSDKKETFF